MGCLAVHRASYRAGGINTPAFNPDPAYGAIQFQTYAPETVKDVELGLKSEFEIVRMPTRFNLALYRAKYEDLQTSAPTGGGDWENDFDGDGVPGDGIDTNNPANSTIYANVGTAVVKGAEVDVTALPVDSLELTLSGAYIDASVDSLRFDPPDGAIGTIPSVRGVKKAAFSGTPKFSGGASARYTLPLNSSLGELSLFMRYFHIDEVTYGSIEAPAGERLDLRFDWKSVLGSNFDVAAFANNVTDDLFPVASGNPNEGLGINAVIYNEPRTYARQRCGIERSRHVDLLPAALGTGGLVIALCFIALLVLSQLMQWLPTLVNNATMLFLTAATIPHLQAHGDFVQMYLALALGSAFFGGFLLSLGALRRVRQSRAPEVSSPVPLNKMRDN